MSRQALLIAGIALLGLGLGLALLASARARPTLIVFVGARAPLSEQFEATLAAAPVQQLIGAHFELRRHDPVRDQALFQRYLGSSGALGAVVVDRAGTDTVAVLRGYADVERFSAFLSTLALQLPKLRELRDRSTPSDAQRLLLGELYAEQGSLQRARSCYETLRASGQVRAAALERLARLDIEAGQMVSARSELDASRKLLPPARADRALLTEALILSRERRVLEAVGLLRGALPGLPAGAERARGWSLLSELQHELEPGPEHVH
jgi:hypothetical protein